MRRFEPFRGDHNELTLRVLAAALSIALLGVGCGGKSVSDAVQQMESIDGSMYCVEAGEAVFAGVRETVYECYEGERANGGEPGAGDTRTGDPIGCFAEVDGGLANVSYRVSDEFTCGRSLRPARSPSGSWVTDDGVNSIVVAGSTVYAAGYLGHVGSRIGALALFANASPDAERGWPVILGGDPTEGYVRSVVPDGRGGWVVGGSFETVDGIACPRLAHITGERQLDRGFCLAPDSDVYALAVYGRTVYIGGRFHRIGGGRRPFLVAADLDSHTLLSGNIAVSGRPLLAEREEDSIYPQVGSLSLHGTTLFVGGFFDRVGGQPRRNLAAIDLVTRRVLPWQADAGTGGRWDWAQVLTLAAGEDALYVTGTFRRLAGQPASGLGAVAPNSARRLPWKPRTECWFSCRLVASGHRVYLANEDRVRALDARSGAAVRAFHPVVARNGEVRSLAIVGDSLYLGGRFGEVGGSQRTYLAAVDRSSGRLLPWAPVTNEAVFALGVDHGVLAAGGTLTSVGGQPRDTIVAIDGRTGSILPWAPRFDGSVSAMARTTSHLYVGGSFRKVNGAPRAGLASFDVATGRLTGWAPTLAPFDKYDLVYEIAASEQAVYVAGEFKRAGGEPRTRLAAFDTASGELEEWNPGLVGEGVEGFAEVTALHVERDRVYVAGDFIRVGGVKRDGFAEIDADTGTVLDWTPRVGGGLLVSLSAVASANGVIYLGGEFESFESEPRAGLAAVDAATHDLLAWSPSLAAGWISTEALQLAPAGTTVAVVGDFRSISGIPRAAVALVDGVTGRVLSWHAPPSETAGFEAESVAASDTFLAFDGYVSSGNADSINVYALRPAPLR